MPTVFLFGAGATKACGGPLTNEILPDAFETWQSYPPMEREGFLELVNGYLIDRQHMPSQIDARTAEDYPPLPRLLAVLDAAIDAGQGMGDQWDHQKLMDVRAGLEYLIFSLLQQRLQMLRKNYYRDLFELCADKPQAISLNYDIIADNALANWAYDRNNKLGFPDYGTVVSTKAYNELPKFSTLLKLHGSLNWYYCPECHSLFVGVSKNGKFYKVLDELYVEEPLELEHRYSCKGSKCVLCQANVRPVLITPSHQRDYENPRISEIWASAREILKAADRIVIIGYSLPDEDNYVTALLSTTLANLDPTRVTVVDMDPNAATIRQSEVGLRYVRLFGDGIQWYPKGFGNWVEEQKQAGMSF